MKSESPYDGDPIIFITEDGLDIYMVDGNISIGDFIHNAVLLSFNADSDNEHHNIFMESSSNRYNGKATSKICDPVTKSYLSEIEKLILHDLDPLVSSKLIWNLEVEASNESGKRTDIMIFYEYESGKEINEYEYECGEIRRVK